MIKPILFNTEMVKAILEGRKTQTRRLVKPHLASMMNDDERCGIEANHRSPYAVGDILWLRETWTHPRPSEIIAGVADPNKYLYKADAVQPVAWDSWHPSIHMPKEAARIFLRVTNVRVERLQDITNDEALLEGVPGLGDYPADPVYCPVCKGEGIVGRIDPYTLGHYDDECDTCDTAVKRFANLWDSTVKGKNCEVNCWEANPWVWVYTFERVDKPEGWCN